MIRRFSVLFGAFFLIFQGQLLRGAGPGLSPLKINGTVQPGRIVLQVEVPSGFYTYASSPYANPIRFIPVGPDGIRYGTPVIPNGKVKGKERILEHRFEVTIPYTGMSAAQASVQVTTEYQLCETVAGVCHMPQSVTNSVSGVFRGAESRPAESGGSGLQGLLQRHLDAPLAAFLIAVLAGLLASLTPCVYPVIPITIGYFSKDQEQHPGRRLARAGVYVGGMSLVYTLLGVVAGLTGSVFAGWINQPGFFLVVGLLFVLLALSMFDIYEFRLPAGPAMLRRSGGGLGGAFLMGVLTGLVASPCVGPVVFFLLTGVLQAGRPVYGALLMGGFSLGMGVLFLLLAVFSQKALHLPKSGNWMVRIKIVLGVLVLASAIYFLTLALQSWGVAAELQMLLTVLLLLFAGGAGVYRLNALYGTKPRHGVFLAVLLLLLAGGLLMNRQADKKLGWPDDPHRALQQAAVEGRPVFMDLYADWCSICRIMEQELLKQPELLAFIKKHYVTVKVNFDRHKDFLQKKYGVRSLPWVLILDSRGRELWKKAGFTDAAAFVQELRTVTARYVTVTNRSRAKN